MNRGSLRGAGHENRREDLILWPPPSAPLSGHKLLDYGAAYDAAGTMLKKVKLGQCVSHDPHSVEQIEWKHSVLDRGGWAARTSARSWRRHARDMRLKVRALPCPGHPGAWAGVEVEGRGAGRGGAEGQGVRMEGIGGQWKCRAEV